MLSSPHPDAPHADGKARRSTLSGRRRVGWEGRSAAGSLLGLLLVAAAAAAVVQYGYWWWSVQTASGAAKEAVMAVASGGAWECARDDALASLGAAPRGTQEPEVNLVYEAKQPTYGTKASVRITFTTLDLGLFPVPDDAVVDVTASTLLEDRPHRGAARC